MMWLGSLGNLSSGSVMVKGLRAAGSAVRERNIVEVTTKKVWQAPELEIVSVLESTQAGTVAGTDGGSQS